MKLIFLALEFLSAIALVIAVLLHSPKGEGLAGIGGHARMFSSQKGLEAGLDRITMVIAAIFLISAIVVGFFV